MDETDHITKTGLLTKIRPVGPFDSSENASDPLLCIATTGIVETKSLGTKKPKKNIYSERAN